MCIGPQSYDYSGKQSQHGKERDVRASDNLKNTAPLCHYLAGLTETLAGSEEVDKRGRFRERSNIAIWAFNFRFSALSLSVATDRSGGTGKKRKVYVYFSL